MNKRCNLLFHGIAETGGTDRAACVKAINHVIVTEMKLNMEEITIGKCYRIGVVPKFQKKPRPRPILVSFPNMADRERIWSTKPKLKGFDTYIVPDLPKEIEKRRLKLLPTFRKAKSMGKYTKTTYLNDDRLTIDKKVYTVDTMGDIPDDLRPELDATQTKDGVTVFFTRYSPLSNHFTEAPFKLGPTTFSSTEQYYFACKARILGDEEKLGQIMAEEDPATIKSLGERVTNFNKIQWETIMYDHMKNGCIEKFKQNPIPRMALLATGTNKLGECSASSDFWGVGMSLYNKERFDSNLWKNNAMGQILMAIRESYL